MSCLSAGVADRHDFAVSGGVIVQNHVIRAFADDFTIANNHRTERSAMTGKHAPSRKLNGAIHEIFVGIGHRFVSD